MLIEGGECSCHANPEVHLEVQMERCERTWAACIAGMAALGWPLPRMTKETAERAREALLIRYAPVVSAEDMTRGLCAVEGVCEAMIETPGTLRCEVPS